MKTIKINYGNANQHHLEQNDTLRFAAQVTFRNFITIRTFYLYIFFNFFNGLFTF